MLSETRQRKNTGSHFYVKSNSQIHRNREYNGGYQGLRREKWGDVGEKVQSFS